MSDLLTEFEQDCAASGVKPTVALKQGGIHPSLWWKWKSGGVSPTLRNFEAAREGLKTIQATQDAA